MPRCRRLDYGRHIPPSAKFFTVNLCSQTLNKNTDIRSPDARVLADPLEFVKRLAELAPPKALASVPVGAAAGAVSSAAAGAASAGAPVSAPAGVTDRSQWFQFVQAEQAARERDIDAMAEREAGRSLLDASGGSFVNPLRLCRAIDAALPDRSVIVADGGDFVGTASYTVRPRQPLAWLDPGVFVSQQQRRTVIREAERAHAPRLRLWLQRPRLIAVAHSPLCFAM